MVSPDLRFTAVAAGYVGTCGLDLQRTPICWGRIRAPLSSEPLSQIVVGDEYACGLSETGSVFCWGKAPTVPGYPAIASTPRRIRLDRPAVAVTAGRRHACVIAIDGSGHCWGMNADGQVGDGSAGISASLHIQPVRVALEAPLVSITAGFDFTCALTVDGRPYCWGSNASGLMGRNSIERCGDAVPILCAPRPVAIEGGLRFKAIAAGDGHVCAVTVAGQVACWGRNEQGQLGISVSPEQRSVDAVVTLDSLRGVATIVAGPIHTCALTTLGDLYCWGGNFHGQLGSGLASSWEDSPRRSQRRFRFAAVAAGGLHTCGITGAGRLLCWGETLSYSAWAPR